MKIFIDSADIEKIKLAWTWGIIDGVTTNPSHVAKTGRKHLDVYREICDLIDGSITSLETVTLTAAEMLEEGRADWPNTQKRRRRHSITKEGLKGENLLSGRHQDQCHRDFSPLQALLAAKCGAIYISLWGGSMRLDILAWMWFAK